MDKEQCVQIDEKYDKFFETLLGAYHRTAKGKGAERHSHGNTEAFTEQWICRGARMFGVEALGWQIGKKNEEILQLPDLQAKINEFYDIIVYSVAAIMVLKEQQKRRDEK